MASPFSIKEAIENLTVRNKSDLRRVGVAEQEQRQDAVPARKTKSLMTILNENLDGLEAILRSPMQVQQWAQDLTAGLQKRDNWVDVKEFDTNSVPVTAGQGFIIDAPRLTGGYPLSSLSVQSVGGAGTTMQVSINGSTWFPVTATSVFKDMEIWKASIRVTTAGAGTGRIFLTAYVPGMRGLMGV